MSNLQIQTINSELVVDSRLIAEELGIQHKNLKGNILRYEVDFLELGTLALVSSPSNANGGGGKGETFYFLNEDQANYLMTLSKNTPQVRAAKIQLVKAFRKAKEALLSLQPDPKPIDSTRLMNQAPSFKNMLEGLGCDPGMATQITFKAMGEGCPELVPLLRTAAKEMGVLQAAEEDYLTPTQIAERLTQLRSQSYSSRSVNALLEKRGFQLKNTKKDWVLTQAGEKFGVRKPFTSLHSNYSSWQILWKESIVNELMDIAA